MQLDQQTMAALLGLTVSIVAVTKFLLPQGPKQNSEVRLLSAVVGSLLFALFAVTHETALSLPVALRDALDAAGQGFLAGAFGTTGVKAYHLAGDALTTLTKRNAPAA